MAHVPVSIAHRYNGADLAFVPVSDLSAREVVATGARPSRSRAVVSFVRAAAEAAADLPEQAAALA
jgi:hypothetical protein